MVIQVVFMLLQYNGYPAGLDVAYNGYPAGLHVAYSGYPCSWS